MPEAAMTEVFLVSVHCTQCNGVNDLGTCDGPILPAMPSGRARAECAVCGVAFTFNTGKLYLRPRPLPS